MLIIIFFILYHLVKNKTIIGLKYLLLLLLHPHYHVKNKTIIGLKFKLISTDNQKKS